MMSAPRPVLLRLNAGKPSRSPEGTAMLAGSTGKHIASAGRPRSGRALGPQNDEMRVCNEQWSH